MQASEFESVILKNTILNSKGETSIFQNRNSKFKVRAFKFFGKVLAQTTLLARRRTVFANNVFFVAEAAASTPQTMAQSSEAPAAPPQKMVQSLDLANKLAYLRSPHAVFTGKLVAGRNGFCVAEFDEQALNFQTQCPNLILEVKQVPRGTKKRPAAHADRLDEMPAAAADTVDKTPAEVDTAVGHVCFSADEETSSSEEAEEEKPKVNDEIESDADVAASSSAAAPAALAQPDPASDVAPPEAEAAPAEAEALAAEGPRYTQEYYKAKHRIGIRTACLEPGRTSRRQAFSFGGKDTKKDVAALREIANQVIQKLAAGTSEEDAERWAKKQL